MGLFSIFSKKATPEQLQERSRREQELAQKYFEIGQKIGRKIGLENAVRKTNIFLNRYPVTFFSLFTLLVILSFVVNMLFLRVNFSSDTARNLQNVSGAVGAIERDSVQMVIETLYDEYVSLNDRLVGLTSKESMTKEDSTVAVGIYDRMTELEKFFEQARTGRIDLSSDSGTVESPSLQDMGDNNQTDNQ